MEYVSKITGLILLRSLNACELDIADNLLRYTHLPTFLEKCNKADIVVAPISMILNCGLFELLANLILKSVLLPVPVPQRLSTDTAEAAASSASLLSDLMRKINDARRPSRIKGVVSASIGIGLNGSVNPGPLAWHLFIIPGVKLQVNTIKPIVTVSYHDRTTNTTRSESSELDLITVNKEMQGTEVLAIMEDFLRGEANLSCPRLEKALREILIKFPFYNRKSLVTSAK